MTAIYKSAARTKVWLGPAQVNSKSALAKLEAIGKDIIDKHKGFDAMIRMNRHGSSTLREEAEKAETEVRERIGDMLKNAAINQEESYELLKDLAQLLSTEYWTRVWILQEIAVSPKVDVICGDSKIKVKQLHAAVLYIILMQISVLHDLFERLNAALDTAFKAAVEAATRAGVEVKTDDIEYDLELKKKFDEMQEVVLSPSAMRVFDMRQEYQNPSTKGDQISEFNLIHLLSQIRVGRGSTEPKDRVYALLGMEKDGEKLGVATNCDKGYLCSTLYCDTARAIIASGNVDLLSLAQPNHNINKPPEPAASKDRVPSWVPDWRQDIMEPWGMFPWHTPYNASGDAKRYKFKKSPMFDKLLFNQLVLSGYKVDCIESLRAQCNKGEYLTREKGRQAAYEYLEDIQELCDESGQKRLHQNGREIYSHEVDRQVAHAFIPVADMIGKGGFYSASVRECIFACRTIRQDYKAWKEKKPLPDLPEFVHNYYNAMARQVSRRPFITEKGYVGLAPSHAQKGDVVVIFRGANFPYTLRKMDNGRYELIGETYAHGIMYGGFTRPEMDPEEFTLE